MPKAKSSKQDDMGVFEDEYDVFSDPDYMRDAGEVITHALRNDCDVVQFADGDILVTEVRTIMYRHSWDSEKHRMVKVELEAHKSPNERTAAENIVAQVSKALEDA